MSSCAYLTGLVVLTGNLIFHLSLIDVHSDRLLIEEASAFLHDLTAQPGCNEVLLELRDAVQDLESYSTLVLSSKPKLPDLDVWQHWDYIADGLALPISTNNGSETK